MSNARPTEGAGEPLTLALQRVPRERVDMSPVTPSALAHASARDVPGIELRAGNRRVRVGEIFDVSGEDTAHVAIRNSCDRLDRLGAGMRFGRMAIHGDTGTHAGAAMAGGVLEIHGNAGAFAASGMAEGFMHLSGNAGDFLGAAIAMRRGTLLVTRVPALPATFADGGPPPRTFLRLLQRHLRNAGGPLAPFAQMTDDIRRFVGDRAYGGLGEILVAQ